MAKKDEKATKATKGSEAAKKAAVTKAAKKVKAVANLIKVAAIRYTTDGEDGTRFVYFRLTGANGITAEDLEKVTVSLSRAPGDCVFAVNALFKHDYHAPPFSTSHMSDEELAEILKEQPYYRNGGEKAADAYMDRVFTELSAKVAAELPGVSIEFEKTEWTTKKPTKPGDNGSGSGLGA